MAGRVTVTECPNCGGPLDPKQLSRSDDPKCPFCHRPISVEADPPPYVLRVSGGADNRPTRGAGVRRRGFIGVAIVLVVGVVVVGVVVVGLLARTTVVNSGGRYSLASSKVVPVASAPGRADFYVIAATIADGQNQVLRRVDPIANKVIWSSGTLDQADAGVPLVVAGPAQALAIFGTTVVALDATAGHQLWRASLSNGLASPCNSGCAVVVGQHLVTLAKDGTVQAFDVTTGAQSWSKRLNSTPRWLEPAGNTVLVSDTAGPTGPDLAVLVLDAGSGAVRKIAPSCVPPKSSPFPAAVPNGDNGFFVSPDGTALTVLITGFDGCVVRYRVSDGAMVWRTAPAGDGNKQVPFTLTGQSATQGQATLAWTSSGAVLALDTGNGAIRQVFTSKATTLKLIGIMGSTLIATAAPQFDSGKPSTIAIDLASGQQRWQIASRVVKSGDSQSVVTTTGNPIIVSCNSHDDMCRFEAVDLQTGTIKGSSTLPAQPGSVNQVEAVDAPSSLAAVVGWQHIAGFDPTTAAVQWRWPN